MKLSSSDLEHLEILLSKERIRRYRQATGGDLAAAFTLYRWNADVSMLIFNCIGRLEIVMRNAIDRELAALVPEGGDWLETLVPRLTTGAQDDIAKARRRIVARKRHAPEGTPPTHGQIVAELSFSFWRYLISRTYARSLWIPGLSRAFPHAGAKLSSVSRSVGRVYELRNRVAHHEPIHAWNVPERHDEIHRILGWIDPVASAWAAGCCTARRLVELRP